MSTVHDPEFRAPDRKAPYGDLALPTCPLAWVSLVSGVLSYITFPLVGAIVAVITGHAAIGRIDESGARLGGRRVARAGVILGYVHLAMLALICLLIGVALLFGLFLVRNVVDEPPSAATVVVDRPAVAQGVRMSNELTRADYDLVDENFLLDPDEEVIGCAATESHPEDPEFALLTNKRLCYLKEGRSTIFPLAEIATIGDDAESPKAAYFDATTDYVIDVERDSGARMRIKIRPYDQGKPFGAALQQARKRAREGSAPQAEAKKQAERP
jgi:hypothetical protein